MTREEQAEELRDRGVYVTVLPYRVSKQVVEEGMLFRVEVVTELSTIREEGFYKSYNKALEKGIEAALNRM